MHLYNACVCHVYIVEGCDGPSVLELSEASIAIIAHYMIMRTNVLGLIG